jgi:serine/threonine protein kinase
VHRDIKPENFLLGAPTLISAPAGTASGVLKISDFGVSAFHQPGEVSSWLFAHAHCWMCRQRDCIQPLQQASGKGKSKYWRCVESCSRVCLDGGHRFTTGCTVLGLGLDAAATSHHSVGQGTCVMAGAGGCCC